MAINFPDSPTSGDIYTVNGKKWQWDGTTWNVVTSVGATNSLSDTDSDTKIVLEETPDSDTIVFTTAATPRFEITSSGHIIPSDNETYDLGSASNRFRDLYLSGSSITLGDANLTSHFSGLNVHSFIADNHVDAPAYYINDIPSISDDSNYLKLDPNGSRVLGVHVNNNLDVAGDLGITGNLSVGSNTDVEASIDAVESDVSTLQTDVTNINELQFSYQTASYTLVLSDAGKAVQMAVASANNLTVPPNSSVAFPVGTQILVIQQGAGQTTIVAGAGVTLYSKDSNLKLSAQWCAATLIKANTDVWVIVGDLSA